MLKHPLKGDLVTAVFCCHQLTVVYWWIWMGVVGIYRIESTDGSWYLWSKV